MIKKTVVWQADAFALVSSLGAGKAARVPVGLVLDPHAPFIVASRVFPEGTSEAACLLAAVEEALFTYGVKPTEVRVKFGKEKALMSLAAKAGFTLVICDELRELSAVKEDFGNYARNMLAAAGLITPTAA